MDLSTPMEDFVSEHLTKKLDVIRTYCLENRQSISVAESVTSGYVQAMLSAAPEAGRFFKGGVTVYSCEAKSRLLDIDLQHCEGVNGVSPEIAVLMAEKIRAVYSTDIGMAITGFAAFVPELGVFTKYAFGSVVLGSQIHHQFNFLSVKTTQWETQIDFAAQLIDACVGCIY